MKRYLFIAAIALSALGISDVHASAENNDYPTVEGRNVPKDQMVRPGDRLSMPTTQLHEEHGCNYVLTLAPLKRTA
jgi:hypothetical protein